MKGNFELKIIFVLSLLSMGSLGCQTTGHDAPSGVKQIENGNGGWGYNYPCDVFNDRIAEMQRRYSRAFNNGSDAQKGMAYEVLTRVPTPVMDFVFIKHNVKVRIYNNTYGYAGYRVVNENGRARLIPTYLHSSVTINRLGRNNFPHELGHTAQGFFQRAQVDFQSDLEATYRRAKSSRVESPNIKPYAKKNDHEFFAEIFDQYYCSDAARRALTNSRKYPNIAPFVAKHLKPFLSAEIVSGTGDIPTPTIQPDDVIENVCHIRLADDPQDRGRDQICGLFMGHQLLSHWFDAASCTVAIIEDLRRDAEEFCDEVIVE